MQTVKDLAFTRLWANPFTHHLFFEVTLFVRSFLNTAMFSAFRVAAGSLFQVLALILATLQSYALHLDFTTGSSRRSVLIVPATTRNAENMAVFKKLLTNNVT